MKLKRDEKRDAGKKVKLSLSEHLSLPRPLRDGY